MTYDGRPGYEWAKVSSGPHEGDVIQVVQGIDRFRVAYRLLLPPLLSSEVTVPETVSVNQMSCEYKRVRFTVRRNAGYRTAWLPADWSEEAVRHWRGRFK